MSPNASYQSGAAFERRIKKDLEKRGYYAIRSAGSHGLIDIAAFKDDIALFIQAKTDGVISPADEAALVDLCREPNFIPILAERVGRKLKYCVLPGGEPFDPGEM